MFCLERSLDMKDVIARNELDQVELQAWPIDQPDSFEYRPRLAEVRGALLDRGCARIGGYVRREYCDRLDRKVTWVAPKAHLSTSEKIPFHQGRPDAAPVASLSPLCDQHQWLLGDGLAAAGGYRAVAQIFKGRLEMHSVVEKQGERHSAIFGYAREPGFIGQVERTMPKHDQMT